MRHKYALIIAGLFVTFVAIFLFRVSPEPERQANQDSVAELLELSPRMSRVSRPQRQSPGPVAVGPNTLVLRAMEGDTSVSVLPPESIAVYLERNRTNAESLLGAFQVTGDPAYLRSAADLFPDDPRVQLQVATHEAFAGERRGWLDRFKQSSPENSIGDYLSAREHFKSGNRDAAIQDLLASATKADFNDFTIEKIQAIEEAHLLAGKSPAEAKGVAFSNVHLPHLVQLRDLAKDMAALQGQYMNAGDQASAERMAQIGATLGHHLSDGGGASSILNQLVGLIIEEELLKRPSPSTVWGFLGRNTGERLAEIQARKDVVRGGARLFNEWLPNASEADLISYFDRVKMYGEPAAISWLASRQN